MTPLEFLFSLEPLGMKFGLENMRTICAALDDPEQSFRSVIVAGTNGKGSVTAMLSAAAHASGVRSARYTSPHLERLEERFVIGEEEVRTTELESAAQHVQRAVERLVRDGALATLPTFFECATAIAFELFRRASVELAILEVGLGGRLDATNVITPMAAAITSIDFDHQALLGDTIAAIAREKAGVIKDGIPVVIGPLPQEAEAVVADVCRERGAVLVRARDRVRIEAGADSTITFEPASDGGARFEHVRLALRGRHQLDNAAVALCVLAELQTLGIPLTSSGIRAGLEHAHWPGRLEAARRHGADVLLDAAHNAAGARALADYLRDIGWTAVTLLIGVMHDKDARAIVAPLAPLATTIICTTPATPRAMRADDLATLAAEVKEEVRSIADPEAALDAACRPGGRVVACGSIFLIGPLRGILR